MIIECLILNNIVGHYLITQNIDNIGHTTYDIRPIYTDLNI